IFKMKYLNLILFFACAILYGQQDTLIPTPAQNQQMYQIIGGHLFKYFQVPQEVYENDSVSTYRYKIEFVIDENGKVTQPQIIDKNTECTSCEAEIIKILYSAPPVEPFILNDKKVQAKFILPFRLSIQ